MINKNTILTEPVYPVSTHHLCWSAVIAGAFVGLGLGFLLNLYGMAIGLSAYSTASENTASTIAIGGVLGMVVGIMVSMGVAGYVAGYLTRDNNRHCGVMHGFIAWSLILLMAAVIAAPLTHYVTAYRDSLTHTVAGDTHRTKVVNESNTNLIQQQRGNEQRAEAQVTPKELAGAGWLVFAMFFVGALSSCVGGYLGTQCCRNTSCGEVKRTLPEDRL